MDLEIFINVELNRKFIYSNTLELYLLTYINVVSLKSKSKWY